METIQLRRAELLREMNPLLDNGEAMCQITSFVRILLNNANVRKGWAAAAQRQHANGYDKLADPDIFADESLEEWTW